MKPEAKPIRNLLRQIGSGAGLLVLGAGIGGSAFLMLDALNPPSSRAAEPAFSLRDPFYHTCREALQDGRASIRRSEPGYRPELDIDRDGVACEPYLRR